MAPLKLSDDDDDDNGGVVMCDIAFHEFARTRRAQSHDRKERGHWKFKDRDATKNRGFVMSHDKKNP